jgi:hypothetical protein
MPTFRGVEGLSAEAGRSAVPESPELPHPVRAAAASRAGRTARAFTPS